MRHFPLVWLIGAMAVVAMPSAVRAQDAAPMQLEESQAESRTETILVIGASPLAGNAVDRDKIPANVQSLNAADLSREGSASLLGALADQAGGINVNDTLGDSFQLDILFRGFTVSPVLGTPQGLAVYQNGVRVNEAFGDTVNWDLIPDIAIDHVDMVSANPVYGLNALGGALAVTMKTGFSHQGFDGELAGGSFNQRSLAFEYGLQSDGFAAYIAGRSFDSSGWRQYSPDHLRQLYADIGFRGERLTVDLAFTGADNRLYGQGTAPEQELAVERTLDFTTPQNNIGQMGFVSLGLTYQLGGTLSLQGNGYRRDFHQTILNGNTTNYTACLSGNGLLCQPDGATPLLQAGGAPIPDLSRGGDIPIGETDRETIRAVSWGGTLQASDNGKLFGLENSAVIGGSIDRSSLDFQTSAELGVINSILWVQNSGYFVNTPENSGFNATPVRLGAINSYYGLYLTDSFTPTAALTITASGRYNLAEVALTDRLGSNLSGTNRYSRFNPALGATYKLTDHMTAYAGYSEGARAPTPSEIECSNPAQPCLLPSSLSSDPPNLKQVVSHSWEAGLRGTLALFDPIRPDMTWKVGVFRTDLDDDIHGVATSISSGFFENIGSTRRQGIETGLTYRDDGWSIFVNYSLVDATFRSSLTLPSPNNPFADADGNIRVLPGDRLPGIPEHQLKLGADYQIAPSWSIGAVLTYFSSQYPRGDESNQDAPLPGYAVVNLHTTLRLSERFSLFANIRNLFDARYETFGQYGDPTGVGAPGIPPTATTNAPGTDSRFVSPSPPISLFAGVRLAL